VETAVDNFDVVNACQQLNTVHFHGRQWVQVLVTRRDSDVGMKDALAASM
jgi:hypothetical protein